MNTGWPLEHHDITTNVASPVTAQDLFQSMEIGVDSELVELDVATSELVELAPTELSYVRTASTSVKGLTHTRIV